MYREHGLHFPEPLHILALDYFSDYAWLNKSMAKFKKSPINH